MPVAFCSRLKIVGEIVCSRDMRLRFYSFLSSYNKYLSLALDFIRHSLLFPNKSVGGHLDREPWCSRILGGAIGIISILYEYEMEKLKKMLKESNLRIPCIKMILSRAL